MHFLGVGSEPGGIGFHNCDASDQILTSLAFVLQFFFEITNAILIDRLLGDRARAARFLSLDLFRRIDFPVQTILVERRRADAK